MSRRMTECELQNGAIRQVVTPLPYSVIPWLDHGIHGDTGAGVGGNGSHGQAVG